MSKTIEVNKESWRKLKIISAQMDKSMKEVIDMIVSKAWKEYKDNIKEESGAYES